MQNLQALKNSLLDREWFCDVGLTEFNKPVVYVHYMNSAVFSVIFNESQSFLNEMPHIHFSSWLLNKNSFVKDLTKPSFTWNNGPEPDSDSESLSETSFLLEEIARLRKICGANILSDIFYEVHDGKNAVTNLSVKFPEVREALNSLYEEYGFDSIYQQVEC